MPWKLARWFGITAIDSVFKMSYSDLGHFVPINIVWGNKNKHFQGDPTAISASSTMMLQHLQVQARLSLRT